MQVPAQRSLARAQLIHSRNALVDDVLTQLCRVLDEFGRLKRLLVCYKDASIEIAEAGPRAAIASQSTALDPRKKR